MELLLRYYKETSTYSTEGLKFLSISLYTVCVLTAVTRHTALNTHTVYKLTLILPLHTNNFNDVL